MFCEQVRPELKALVDGEISQFMRWRVQRHLARCADCRAQFASLQRLNALLLSADPVGSLPASTPVHSPLRMQGKRRIGMPTRLIGGLAFTGALMIALLTIPRSHTNLSMAAEVRQALQQVNTWHLYGWKLQDGKQIPWEVWGQRTPFFYREQIGPDLVIDNGVQRVSLFAPKQAPKWSARRNIGIALQTSSMHDSENVRWSYQHMVTPWQNGLKPWKQTPSTIIFNLPDSAVFLGGERGDESYQLYSVDKATWLPIQYKARMGHGASLQTIAFLRAEYNIDIPTAVAALPSIPSTYQVYDTMQAANLPHNNVVSDRGLTIQVSPLAVDTKGYVLARVRGWLGGTLLDRDSPVSLFVTTQVWSSMTSMDPPANYDDQQRPYTQVYWQDLESANRDRAASLLLLAPVEPLPDGAAPPETLTLSLEVSLHMDTRFKGTLGQGDSQLSMQTMSTTVPLPEASGSMQKLAYRFLDPTWRTRSFCSDGFETLQSATDNARGGYYGHVIDFRHPDRPRLAKAAAWSEKYIHESPTRSAVQLERYSLAQIYVLLGNRPRARQLLEAMRADHTFFNNSGYDSSKLSSVVQAENREIEEGNRRAAERALRTWAR